MTNLLQKFLVDPFDITANTSTASLQELVQQANHAYFNTSHPIISDEYYDILVERLRERGVSIQIGTQVSSGHVKVKLPYFLPSLNKIKSKNEIKDVKKNESFMITDKLDGISALLCKNMLYTRGDGEFGMDISFMLKYIQGIPKICDNVVVRGELIIPKKLFQKKYSCEYANGRNFVSGIVNSCKNRNVHKIKDIHFVAFELVDPWMDFSLQFKKLHQLCFKVVYNIQTHSLNNLDIILKERKLKGEYDIDGIVLSEDRVLKRNSNNSNPDYSYAYKQNVDRKNTKVLDVEWNQTKHGYLKPRVLVESINLSGVNIQYVTGFNAKYICDNKIGKGAVITLVRSGEVIPHIVNIVKPASNVSLPDHLIYEWTDTKVDIVLSNKDVDENVRICALVHFLKEIGVKHIDQGLVKKLYHHGICTIPQLMELKTHTQLIGIEGLQEKLRQKIVKEIQTAFQKATLIDVIIGSNLFGRGLGRKRVTTILQSCPDILLLENEDEIHKILIKIDGISDKMASLFEKNVNSVKDLLKTIGFHDSRHNTLFATTTTYEHMNIVFSGFRNQEWEKIIQNGGGHVLNTISKKTSILVANVTTSSKYVKAQCLGIRIMDSNTFQQHFSLP